MNRDLAVAIGLERGAALCHPGAMGLIRDTWLCRAPAVAFVAVGLFWGTFAAYVPVLKPRAGLSDGGFGAAMFVASIGAVAAMWMAPAVDRVLRRRAMPVLAALLAAAFLLPGVAQNAAVFAVAMFTASVVSGTLDVIMNARVSALEAAHARPLMSLNHGLFSVGYAVAALAAGAARELGLPPLAAFVAMGVVTLGLTAVMARDPGGQAEAADGTPRGRLPMGLVAPIALIALIGFMAEQGTEGWSALHLERSLGAGAAEGAFGPAILGMTMALGRFSGQMVATRFSEASVLRIAAAMSAAGALIAAFAPALWVAYLGFAILGLGVSVTCPMAFAWIGRLAPPRLRLLALSRVAALGYFGFFVGPPMMGGLSACPARFRPLGPRMVSSTTPASSFALRPVTV